MAESPGVLEFFAGRDVLVTGATGFMGKVLIEKLLRCCPDIRRIYIIVRPKRGIAPSARVEQMTKLTVFQRINHDPMIMAKICPLEGDMSAAHLGLSEEDQLRVFEDVSVVFHMAASLNFNAPLKFAVEDNTTGTKRILDFGCRMKNLVSFVYVSTTFCNCEQDIAEERVYTPRIDPHIVMRLCEGLDVETVDKITPQLLGIHPNCYTFTKQLAEALVAEYHPKLPLSIARPSIVVPALREPCRGWVDNLNGPTGLLIASGKGLIRSVQMDPEAKMELVPVDVCINAIVVAAYKRPQLSGDETTEIPVYNISSNQLARWGFGELLRESMEAVKQNPFQIALWYPSVKARTNKVLHTFIVLFTQIIPAYCVDFLLALMGRKTFLVRVQKKIAKELRVLEYFRMRSWDFRNEKAVSLWASLNRRDQEIFFINNAAGADRTEFIKNMVLGIRQYCCKEPLESLPKSRRLYRTLFLLHHTCLIVTYLVCGWVFFRILKTCSNSMLLHAQ